ncbi:MAG TPA: hypothetical protein VND65_17975 [Candidatus Binatia bacterium]|nr:hypothetical protein [Candidatus Binatia bacterium]
MSPDSNRTEFNTSLFVIEVLQRRSKIWTPLLSAHMVFFTLATARAELPEDTDMYRVKRYQRVDD